MFEINGLYEDDGLVTVLVARQPLCGAAVEF